MPHQDGVNTSRFVKGGMRLVGGLRKIKQMDEDVMLGGRNRERGREQTRASFNRQPGVNARSLGRLRSHWETEEGGQPEHPALH